MRLGAAARRVTGAWRRSLQLRVGATTVAVTGVVVLLVALFLVDKVAGGVLKSKRDAAINQARIGQETARGFLAPVDASVAAEVAQAQKNITASLTANGASAGVFSIEIKSSAGPSSDPAGPKIPRALR